jgi:preprotein translocase subunit SecG
MFFTMFLAAATAAPAAVPAAPKATVTLSPAALQQMLQSQSVAHQTWLAQHAGWLTHAMAGIFIVSAVALVVLLAVQTTKQEGLSGTIGGRVESAYRPRLGFDQQLQRITTIVAITFAVFATLVSIAGI